MAVPLTCRRGMEKCFTGFQLDISQLAKRSVVVILGPSTMPTRSCSTGRGIGARPAKKSSGACARAFSSSSLLLLLSLPVWRDRAQSPPWPDAHGLGHQPSERLWRLWHPHAKPVPHPDAPCRPRLSGTRAPAAHGFWKGVAVTRLRGRKLRKGTGGTLAPIFLSVLRCSGCGGGGGGRSTMLVGAPALVTFRLSILAPVTSPHTAGTSALSSFRYAGKWSTRARAHPAIARL